MIRIEWYFDLTRFMVDIHQACGRESSLREIADTCGVSASTLSRMENGLTQSIESVFTICSALELDPRKYIYQMEWTGTRKE